MFSQPIDNEVIGKNDDMDLASYLNGQPKTIEFVNDQFLK